MIRYSLVCDAGTLAAAGEKGRVRGRGPRKVTGCGHVFEAWFQSSAAFDTLAAAGQVSCPLCGSERVAKGLMAPSVKTSRARERTRPIPAPLPEQTPDAPAATAAPDVSMAMASLSPEQREVVAAMRKLRAHVLANSENVGKGFAEEARKIHHGESKGRGIHGEASLEDAKALLEDGIEVLPLPALPEDRN